MKYVEIDKIEESNPQDIYHLKVYKNHNFFGNNLCLHNCDYRGEVCVLLVNLSNESFEIHNGDRIAQMVINKYEKIEFESVEELSNTVRGEGGFNSTGVK